jgi:hypothetical protein
LVEERQRNLKQTVHKRILQNRLRQSVEKTISKRNLILKAMTDRKELSNLFLTLRYGIEEHGTVAAWVLYNSASEPSPLAILPQIIQVIFDDPFDEDD